MFQKKHFLILLIGIFIAVCVASSLSIMPQIDEGFFASPAHNLANYGFFGTTTIDEQSNELTHISQHTYWVMPLFLLNVSAFFKIFGTSIFIMRLVSIFWGIVALFALYILALKTTKNERVAILSVALLAFDYTFIIGSSYGRMDVMCSAFGLSAMACFVHFREKNLRQAILLSQTFVVLAGLTHPIGGLLAFLGTAFVTFFLEWKNLKIKHFLIALIPYLIGGFFFGLYVLPDIQGFRDQFFVNATMGGRMNGFSSPLSGLIREFTVRYPLAFGFSQSSEYGGIIFLKILIPFGYLLGIGATLLFPKLRQTPNASLFLLLSLLYFLGLALLDGQKLSMYLVHIIPFYVVLLAILLCWLWENQKKLRFLIIAFLFGFIGLQLGGILLKIRQNTGHTVYQPAINFLRSNAKSTDTIFGSATFAFGLDFSSNLIGDNKLGLTTGKQAQFLIFDIADLNAYENGKSIDEKQRQNYQHFLDFTNNKFDLIYDNKGVKIYRVKNYSF